MTTEQELKYTGRQGAILHVVGIIIGFTQGVVFMMIHSLGG